MGQLIKKTVVKKKTVSPSVGLEISMQYLAFRVAFHGESSTSWTCHIKDTQVYKELAFFFCPDKRLV